MANTIKIGADEIDDLKVGSVQVDKVYVGSTRVWQKSEPPGEWPQGVADEKAYYNVVSYTYHPGSSTGTQYWYAADVPETMPYYVVYYTEDQTWHNGMGDLLPSNPTQNP